MFEEEIQKYIYKVLGVDDIKKYLTSVLIFQWIQSILLFLILMVLIAFIV